MRTKEDPLNVVKDGKAHRIYKDAAGNTLWSKWLKGRKRYQIYAKNAEGKLVTDESIAILAKRAGIRTFGQPLSEKGRIIERHMKKVTK